jgi:DNA invertase Pin-like site-specific DNA recombinase
MRTPECGPNEYKKLAWGYLRVSGEGQLDGFGFERQCETIQTYADRAGYILLGVTMEQYTGKEAERPALDKLIAFCKDNGIKTIIVECSDRFARYLEVQNVLNLSYQL